MEYKTDIIFLALLPFIGTSLGASSVFFLKQIGQKTEKLLYGFAAGVMMAASVWSLLIPSEEMSGSWCMPFIGFVSGALFLIVLEYIVSRIESQSVTKDENSGKIRHLAKGKFKIAMGIKRGDMAKDEGKFKTAMGIKRGDMAKDKGKFKTAMGIKRGDMAKGKFKTAKGIKRGDVAKDKGKFKIAMGIKRGDTAKDEGKFKTAMGIKRGDMAKDKGKFKTAMGIKRGDMAKDEGKFKIAKKTSRNNGNNKPKVKSSMLAFAVTLHNLPEGMAVGVVLASLILGTGDVAFADVFALTLGIAIQNFPEGAIISLPKRNMGKFKAFVSGMLSGIVEPIGVVITILLVSQITACLPFLLAFAAGAMIFVVAEELIPESHHKAGIGAIGASVGFAVMMLLDMALG